MWIAIKTVAPGIRYIPSDVTDGMHMLHYGSQRACDLYQAPGKEEKRIKTGVSGRKYTFLSFYFNFNV